MRTTTSSGRVIKLSQCEAACDHFRKPRNLLLVRVQNPAEESSHLATTSLSSSHKAPLLIFLPEFMHSPKAAA